MARVIMEWYPENEKAYSESRAENIVADDADVFEMFDIWKRQMSLLGYFMDDYELIRRSEEEG